MGDRDSEGWWIEESCWEGVEEYWCCNFMFVLYCITIA